MPPQPAATLKRPLSSPPIATLNPCPTSPSTAFLGSSQSSRKISAVFEERRQSLFSISLVEYPFFPLHSIIKAVSPSCFSLVSASVRAIRMAMSATPAFEIQVFVPFRAHLSPREIALVLWLAASEPATGSVRAKHPINSPLHSAGRYFRFCSSVPQLRMHNSTSDTWTDRVVLTDEHALPISSVTMAWLMK